MEKAILKTLIYFDLFDFPLKAWEIQKWLISRKSDLNELDQGLRTLIAQKKIAHRHGLIFLKDREVLVSRRLRKLVLSEKLLPTAYFLSRILLIIPWLQLVGITGNLGLMNSGKKDRIELLILTSKNRLWISRLLTLGLLDFFGAKKKCAADFISIEALEGSQKDIYTAHQILQMKVVWQRNEMYRKYLYANSWVFELLPNWITQVDYGTRRTDGKFKFLKLNDQSCKVNFKRNRLQKLTDPVFLRLENWAKRVQKGVDQSSPDPSQLAIVKEYSKRLKRLKLN